MAAVVGVLAASLPGCTILDEMFGKEPLPERISVSEREIDRSMTPNLARVPGRAPSVMTVSERTRLAQALASDRAAANFLPDPTLAASGTAGGGTTAGGVAAVAAATRQAVKVDRPTAPDTLSDKPTALFQPRVAGSPVVGQLGSSGPEELAAVVFFPSDSVELSDQDDAVLRDVAALLRERGGGLRVIGYGVLAEGAQGGNRDIDNLQLSLRRADVVARQLRRSSVPQGRIVTQGRGAGQAGAGQAGAGVGGGADQGREAYLPKGTAGDQRVEVFLMDLSALSGGEPRVPSSRAPRLGANWQQAQ